MTKINEKNEWLESIPNILHLFSKLEETLYFIY